MWVAGCCRLAMRECRLEHSTLPAQTRKCTDSGIIFPMPFTKHVHCSYQKSFGYPIRRLTKCNFTGKGKKLKIFGLKYRKRNRTAVSSSIWMLLGEERRICSQSCHFGPIGGGGETAMLKESLHSMLSVHLHHAHES